MISHGFIFAPIYQCYISSVVLEFQQVDLRFYSNGWTRTFSPFTPLTKVIFWRWENCKKLNSKEKVKERKTPTTW